MTSGLMAQIVITRPVGGAGALPRKLRALGFAPVHLPSLSLTAAADAPAVRLQLEALPHNHGVVAVSAAAVRFARALHPALHLPARVRAYAVGAATARALQAICAGRVEWPARADSEGLLALPSLAAVDARRIAILAAPGGRMLLAESLGARGATVDMIHVYQRRPARWDRRHRQALAALRRPRVWLTSAEAMRQLLRLAGDDAHRLLEGCAIVSSARLEAAAREAGFATVQRAAGPQAEALLAALRAS
jgi:uroporphyrinogen-III synthase